MRDPPPRGFHRLSAPTVPILDPGVPLFNDPGALACGVVVVRRGRYSNSWQDLVAQVRSLAGDVGLQA